MGISPPSDIILDVARAADPMKYQAASNRLMELGTASNSTEFAEIFNKTAARPFGPASSDAYALRTALRNSAALSDTDKTSKTYEQFEALILQNFIETMMPKDAADVFGKGTAGDVWKSMMAEHISAQLARSGGIGIAAKVLAAHPAGAGAGEPKSESPTDKLRL